MADLTDRIRSLADCPTGRPERLLLRVPEAAAMCALGRTKAYELVASGVWPSIHIDKAVRIPLDGLLAWIDKQLQDQDQ